MNSLIRHEEVARPVIMMAGLNQDQPDTKREHRLRIAVTGLLAVNLFLICGVVTVTALVLGVVR